MTNKCSKCGHSDFKVCIEPDDFTRNSQSFTVNVKHSVCQNCGYEVIFTEQIKRNDIILQAAWNEIDKQ